MSENTVTCIVQQQLFKNFLSDIILIKQNKSKTNHLRYFRGNRSAKKFTPMLALGIQSSPTDDLQVHSVNCCRHYYNA